MASQKQTILERLKLLGIRPSKGLGQNFLVAEAAYRKIVEAAKLEPGETVLEIGPGLGTLTEQLAATGAQVIAVEKDRKLIQFLENLLGDKTRIVEGDALKFNPSGLGLKAGEYNLIANIPYYITGQLLKNIYEVWPRPAVVVLLLQKEVAQRLVAQPPHSNILALTVQYFAQPKIIATIPRHHFYPAPKVDSAIVRLVTKGQSQETNEEMKKLFKLIKVGFSSKRKKLVNNLSAGLQLSKQQISAILKEVRVAENARPENLTLDQWRSLTQRL